MPGKEYSEEAYRIRQQFDGVVNVSKQWWQDNQAIRFGYDFIDPITQSLQEMQLPIEIVVDEVEQRLQKIQEIANGL